MITHKIVGIPIFAAVMFLVFYISQTTVGTWIADWLVAWIETFQGWVGTMLADINPFLYALLVDGIIGGVGAVVGFLPLVMVMYFLIALLEDCGGFCTGKTADDVAAAALLLEKGCEAALYAKLLGDCEPLNPVDARLQRLIYQTKYSRKKEGQAQSREASGQEEDEIC